MKILLMGPPASGKGTVGDRLSVLMNIPLISVGDVLRDLSPEHPRYEEVHSLMQAGELAPQDFVAELLQDRVTQPDCANGFIVDGWGRKVIDLVYFDPGFDKVLALNLSIDSAVKRISSRRVCEDCGEVYNLMFIPPKTENMCDKCGGRLVQRKDDSEEVVRKRYQDQWMKDAQEVLEKFRTEGKLLEIDAEPAPDIVFKSVVDALRVNELSQIK